MKVNLDKYIKENKKTEIIFDLDGTLGKLLIDWNDEYRLGIRETLSQVDEKLVKKYPIRVTKTAELVYEIQKKYGEKAKKLMDKYCTEWEDKNYQEVRADKKLINWVKKRKDLKFYLWSSNQRKTVLKAIRDLELEGVFEKIISADEVSNTKPDSAGFRLIKDKEIEKDRYVFIGDSRWDKGAAKEAGLDYIDVEEVRW